MAFIFNFYEDWKDDKERLILYADIMGFKSRVLSMSHSKIKKDFKKFKELFDKKITPLSSSGESLKYVQFSDSILIVVNGVDNSMFNLISQAASILMEVALSMGFPIKGVISQGVFTYEKESELYFGRPLVDAAVLHDEMYFYGILVHNSAEKTVKKYNNLNYPYTKTSVFLKKGKTCHYHLAWNVISDNIKTSNGKKSKKSCDANKWLESIQEQVSGSPRIYIDNTLLILHEDEKEFNKMILKNMEIKGDKEILGYQLF